MPAVKLIKTIFVLAGFITISGSVYTQKTAHAIDLLLRLDSLSKTNSVSHHFAGLYRETTIAAINFFSARDERVQELFDRLETRFAGFFFRSAIAYNDKAPVDEVWKAYYSDSAASPLRYILHGINAHINGDICQALIAEFSKEEIEELKPHYLSYQKELVKCYSRLYEDALEENKRMKVFHAASFGFDRLYGKILLDRWRKRQIRLAEIYYSNPLLFEKKRKRLRQKMGRLDKLIKKNI